MWFTRTADGWEGSFVVKKSNGVIRTGLVAGDFTITVVDPTDTNANVPAVTESAVKPGLYMFPIPMAFFTTNGTGGYKVVMEVSATGPTLRDAKSKVLRVFDEDFDSLAVDIGAISGANATHLNVAYDSVTTTINFQAWLERSGASVTAPTAMTITWFDTDSTILFTATQAGAIATQNPDAGGVYWFTLVQALADDVVYYVDVSITDATSTVVTRIGIETIANP